MAITLLVFVSLVFGILELSMLVFQQHVVNHLSRQIARQAIVHGEHAREDFAGGPWGPEQYGPTTLAGASADDLIAKTILNEVIIIDPARTTVTIEWPDGNNEVESRVRVRLTSEVDALVGMFTSGASLTGESEMRIAH